MFIFRVKEWHMSNKLCLGQVTQTKVTKISFVRELKIYSTNSRHYFTFNFVKLLKKTHIYPWYLAACILSTPASSHYHRVHSRLFWILSGKFQRWCLCRVPLLHMSSEALIMTSGGHGTY